MKLIDWFRGKVTHLSERLKEPISLKAKLLITVLILVIVFGGGFVAYKFYDFTQNNPKFCVGCHLMQPAYDSWSQSEHKSLNCHECHHLTIPEQNQLLISFVLHRPTAVPERHKGQVIVLSSTCAKCHTEGKAERINKSLFHAKHVFMEQIECTACHGEVKPDKSGLHHFLPTEKFCTNCHKNRQVHGVGMGGLACINCHTDRTKDLKPGRFKCLYCHSTDESIKEQLMKDNTMDVRFFTPDAATVNKATKIKFDKNSPMQFYCYECHKPHEKGKVLPTNAVCLRCHTGIPKTGKHKLHLGMDMKCKDCHKPHMWRVTEASAKKDCVTCHEYRSPKAFL
ncbi:MAG: cytochrome c3 family protein [Nitrospiraceae bacterium]|nr:cytochrome c3 family protein [Nitrospiraceae bacterium]